MIAVRPVTRTLQSLALLAVPHGGQKLARRNAWGSMSSDSARARARVEAFVAMSRALAPERTAAGQ